MTALFLQAFTDSTYWQVAWYEDHGCSLKCVDVPKGGMVLWDSRVIHDNRPPKHDSVHKDRWRFVVFVSMTPAVWASKRDLEKKRNAYENLLLTNHYSSQEIRVLSDRTPPSQRVMAFRKLPKVAQSSEARRLAGVEAYDFDDGEPDGKPPPVWLDDWTELNCAVWFRRIVSCPGVCLQMCIRCHRTNN